MDPLDRTAQAVADARFALGIALGGLTMAHTMGHDTAAATTAYTAALAALETAIRADERAHWQGVIADSAPRRRAADAVEGFEVLPDTPRTWRTRCHRRHVCDTPCATCLGTTRHVEDPSDAC